MHFFRHEIQLFIMLTHKPLILHAYRQVVGLTTLRMSFVYHFRYFTQILSWIRDHVDFIEKWIQPVCDKMGFYHIDVKVSITYNI